MAPQSPTIPSLAAAKEHAGKYEWSRSADVYKKIFESGSLNNNPAEGASVNHLAGDSYLKAGFQSSNRDQLKETMRLARSCYEQASALYASAGLKGLSKHSKARGMWTEYWINDSAEERRMLLANIVELTEEALRILGQTDDLTAQTETRKDLLTFLSEDFTLATDWKRTSELFTRVSRVGEELVSDSRRSPDPETQLESLYLTYTVLAFYDTVLRPAETEPVVEKLRVLSGMVSDLSKRVGTSFSLSLGDVVASIDAGLQGECQSALVLAESAISAAEKTRDTLLIGRTIASTEIPIQCLAWTEDDVDSRRRALERGLQLASLGVKYSAIPRDGVGLGGHYNTWNDRYNLLANFVENDPSRKKEFLQKAIEVGDQGLSYSDFIGVSSRWALCRSYHLLAALSQSPGEKRKLLGEALHRSKELILSWTLYAPHSWQLGSQRNYLALIEAELSTVEADREVQVELLNDAVFNMKQCLEANKSWAKGTPRDNSVLGRYSEWYGDVLARLYSLTGDSQTTQNALQVYRDAASYYAKGDRIGAAAAVEWKIARAFDLIGDYKEASKAFNQAREDYTLAAGKIHASSSIFEELASYMDAWVSIEEARAYHGTDQYLQASESYNRVAETLQRSVRWNYLASHYKACAYLEAGEAHSRLEERGQAIESFGSATSAFREARTGLEKKLVEEAPTDTSELKDWISISQAREKYVGARLQLEEAKELDRKGDKEASAARFASASQAFRQLTPDTEKEQSRRELEALSLFCQAWSKMKEAEASASASLYNEASNFFIKTKEVATKKKFGILALANSAMCKALEYGTKFRQTRDTSLYADVKKQLEVAADYYDDAAVPNAADWTRATQRLFDALVYLADAETEREPKKKTELYHLSEKHLQLAAKLYDEAGYPSKREEVLRHLRKVREEKELLLTPIDALAENPTTSEATVAPVSLIRDQAAGIEKFQDANVVGSLNLPAKELNVGSDVTLELEVANVGKTAATLIKLENLTPEGLEFGRRDNSLRVVADCIDLRGKRLEYLKTHEVKIPLRAVRRGSYKLHPRIIFADEKGSYRSFDFEPVTLTVGELGIAGWLKGPK